MTAVDLDALAAARAAATPGPWAEDGRAIRQPEGYDVYPVVATDYGVCRATDAALIVAAVNALPHLIADARELRALREAVEGLAGLVEQGRAWTGDSLARRLRAILAAVNEGERE